MAERYNVMKKQRYLMDDGTNMLARIDFFGDSTTPIYIVTLWKETVVNRRFLWLRWTSKSYEHVAKKNHHGNGSNSFKDYHEIIERTYKEYRELQRRKGTLQEKLNRMQDVK